ncbi:nuclear transport factor 2 family protein [Streptomyces lasiicapitis]|uniref:nuclear transport factor 2 family protein n=1 Tax=Streptomyces lasiicapitis TaxID=1923961 RepID=UPI00331E845C
MTTLPTSTSGGPRAVLTAMYAAEARYLAAGGPGRASFDLLAPYFAPDVVLHQADALPYGGTWRGHEGMERFFLAMSAAWTEFEIGEQRFLVAEDGGEGGGDGDGGTVVVRSEIRARARATGRELAFPILQTITIADGRITEVWPFYWDTAALAEACREEQAGQ